LLGKAVSGDRCKATFPETITQAELERAHREAMALPFSPGARKALWSILEEINKEGVFPGDRRVTKSVGAARAFAYLRGASEVLPEHLEILAHVLWDDPTEQPGKVAKVVARIANPAGMQVNSLLAQVEDVLDKEKPTAAVPKLQVILKELQGIKDQRALKAVAYVESQIKETYSKVIGMHNAG
jgi:MoxR-like ATPase